ncbi:MAG TPA: MBL fold metallo-hydrolase [Caulobacterales bacterium]|nr:MBL fold metallo-hydrolase [Caulobacterales bacterium]
MSTSAPKLSVRIVPVTPLQQNCSLLWNEDTKHALLIDPGGDADVLMQALSQFGLALTRMWLTHGHLDHAGAAAELRERTGVAVEGPHAEDQFWLDRIESDATRYGVKGLRNVTPDRYFDDGEALDFEGARFDVIHTPGHTPGHVVIFNRDAKLAFVGDVLFQGSIGRTDFPRGDHATLIASITQKLWPLGEDVRFVPGHGPLSTFGQERRANAFVADRITGYAGAPTTEADAVEQKLTKRWT